MGVNWTEEQQQVIRLRDRNILVSAAAGSGKTAVLVERIISMLTDPLHPIDVDRLLIVTFTKAAAAEMKERIRDAIEKLLEEHPEQEHLKRQSTLIHSAQITTIDSFCQMIIKEQFHRIDLDPGFRVAEEGELKLLKQDVLSELLEARYDEGDPDFLNFAEGYAAGRDDKKLEELILQLYEYSGSYPNPEKWLAQCLKAYEPEKTEEGMADETTGGLPGKLTDQVMKLVSLYLLDAKEMLEEADALCKEPDGPYMYEEMIDSDQKIVKEILEAASFEEMYEKSAPIREKTAWKRLSAKRDASVSVEKKEKVKLLRNAVKKTAEDICDQFFYASPEELAGDLERCRKPAQVLISLVNSFAKMFSEKKRSRNMIDFRDMEQLALQILTREEGEMLVPSPAAKEYQDRYVEVMIDEYQDSNLLQEAILTSVSTVSRGKNNIFMVGDVKQSIYRFRLSRPELFMEKFDTYSLEDSEKQRIDLHRNFRSREEVLFGVNYIFRQIMRKELGGITYDDRAALYPGASYEPQKDERGVSLNRMEVLLLDPDKEGLEDAEVTDTDKELEARLVAGRIKELLQNGRVLDKDLGICRKPTYRDIVILTRSVKGWVEVFSEVLKNEGIPTYAGGTEGYFETYEISLLLDYLKVLDNERQDLPLTAVLTSPLCGLSAQELAQIRNVFPDGTFYEAVWACVGRGVTEGTIPEKQLPETVRVKLKDTMDMLEYFRRKVPYTAIQDLLWEILEKTGYYRLVSVMPGGEQRKANLDMLLTKAAAFEETSYKGLFHFVRYIEQLKTYDVDYGEASITDEQMDAVRFFSIHKSKGLEFPIVFVCGLSKRFNRQDVTGSVVIHPELGIGIDAVDLNRRTKGTTLLKKLIQKEVLLDNLGEELRVLYVAMTRAKEKLILTGTLSKAEEKLDGYRSLKNQKEAALSFGKLSGVSSYMDWILPALAGKPDEVPIDICILKTADLAEKAAVEMHAEGMAEEILLNWDAEQIFDRQWKEELDRRLTYLYPDANDQRMKLKFTVSELKKRAYLGEEEGEVLVEEPEVIPLLPKFMQEEDGLTGASRGSAYHRLLELLDFSREYGALEIQEQMRIFVEEEKISREMAECIRPEDIVGFLNTHVGRRMQTAALKGRLKKEQPFVLGVDAEEVYPGEKSEELILVQGIIDVYFEEEGGIILLDYKTDRLYEENQFKERYKAQLEYYAKALERLTGKPVKESWIYSFTMKKEIRI